MYIIQCVCTLYPYILDMYMCMCMYVDCMHWPTPHVYVYIYVDTIINVKCPTHLLCMCVVIDGTGMHGTVERAFV